MNHVVLPAGVAAGFNAPIAGVFFAVESVLQREPVNSETEAKNSSGLTIAMILLAAVLAAIVSRAGLGDTPAFKVPPYEIQSVWELPLILVLGAICGVVSVGFSYLSEVAPYPPAPSPFPQNLPHNMMHYKSSRCKQHVD